MITFNREYDNASLEEVTTAHVEQEDFVSTHKAFRDLATYLEYVADFLPHNERCQKLASKAREYGNLWEAVSAADNAKVTTYAKKNTPV